jgi:hypothetical protein
MKSEKLEFGFSGPICGRFPGDVARGQTPHTPPGDAGSFLVLALERDIDRYCTGPVIAEQPYVPVRRAGRGIFPFVSFDGLF